MSLPQACLSPAGKKGKAVLAMPTEVRQVNAAIADFQLVELNPGRAGRHDTKRCPGDKPRQGPESCTLSQDIRGNSQAAPAPPPRGEDALRDSGVSTREGCASSSSKKRTLFPLSIFFFPSGLNPLLERDKSISRETGSLCSQGLSQLPLSFCHGVTQQ